jgi:hypothetical protein
MPGSCKCPNYDPPTQDIAFRIVDHNGKTPLESTAFYWYADGVKMTANSLYPSWPDRYDSVQHQNVSDTSRPYLRVPGLVGLANSGVKTFYLQYRNGYIDTLEVSTTKVDGGSKRCPTVSYYVETVKQDGVPVATDSSYLTNAIVYPLQHY